MRIDENELFEYGYTKDQVNQFRELLEFNDYGVCCFTANDVNYLPMWAYYSNNHEGFCVEYDVVKPSAIHEVFYEADRIQVGSLINEINIAGRQSLLLGRKTEECNRYLYYLLQNLFIKAKTWQNEKEYRIVYGIDNTIGNNIKLSNVGIKTRRIIAGINCSEENVHRLNSISMKLKCGNASKCILSDKHFGIELQMIK